MKTEKQMDPNASNLENRSATAIAASRISLRAFAIVALAAMIAGGNALAETFTVTVAPSGVHIFQPQVVSIQPGDTVRWVWDDGGHNVTSGDTTGQFPIPDGMYQSGIQSKNYVFSFTFQNAGDFEYYCGPHYAMGMAGTVKVGAAPTPTPSPTPTGTPGLVANVSTRLPVGTDDNVLIEGFIVQGPAGSTKKIIVRAIGPSLAPFGIADALANPTLDIFDVNNAKVATNNDWKVTQQGGLITGDQFAEISASQLAPSNDLESAIIANLAPGNYTAVVRGLGNTIGTGLVDAYDLSAASPARLANIATRGLIQPGDKLMIAGFIVQNAAVRAVVRAIGPSLAAFNIANALPDTTLQLRDHHGTIVRENDDWQTDPQQKQELEGTGLQPGDPREAAIVGTIQPGQYTIEVRGKPETTGIGVVEVYFLQ